jgi:hypothetical protein
MSPKINSIRPLFWFTEVPHCPAYNQNRRDRRSYSVSTPWSIFLSPMYPSSTFHQLIMILLVDYMFLHVKNRCAWFEAQRAQVHRAILVIYKRPKWNWLLELVEPWTFLNRKWASRLPRQTPSSPRSRESGPILTSLIWFLSRQIITNRLAKKWRSMSVAMHIAT